MYKLGPPFSGTQVPPGTNLLVSGPPLSGKRSLAMETLAVGARRDEGTIIVSTRDSAARVHDMFGPLVDGETEVAIVDAVSQHIGRSTDIDMTSYASSPRDLSEIGVKFSEFIQSFYTDQQREHNRVMVDSLTTLLLYSNLQTVFRFLHVFTSRVENVDGLGLYTIESTAHDAETLSTLDQLFDGTIELDADGTATLTLPDTDARTATL
ncbi:RAD55 family ATPase [Haloarcula salinisoli]|uniref:Recombinase RecA n=1 Tax=Haloarcula salinisoli TaxID=2487746 RepID=A0A8J7YE38_9EURY|nr:ATPase domain-containing protein [Halomicroarcula salinisoli]MBX0284754.1 recombinase RecA [Halomicroarcula salinisoli]MBX0303787.1 recombinase RecA [Halomicroarcula salinisoli]